MEEKKTTKREGKKVNKERKSTLRFVLIILVIALALGAVMIFTNKKGIIIGGQNIKYEDSIYRMDVSANVPNGQDYKFIDGDPANITYLNGFSKYTLMGQKIRISFDVEEYNFNKSEAYVAKYGKDKTMNFEAYKQFLLDKDISNFDSKDVVKTTVNGREALRYYFYSEPAEFGEVKPAEVKGHVYLINVDDISTDFCVKVTVFGVDENADINKLVNEGDVKSIINSLKFVKHQDNVEPPVQNEEPNPPADTQNAQ